MVLEQLLVEKWIPSEEAADDEDNIAAPNAEAGVGVGVVVRMVSLLSLLLEVRLLTLVLLLKSLRWQEVQKLLVLRQCSGLGTVRS